MSNRKLIRIYASILRITWVIIPMIIITLLSTLRFSEDDSLRICLASSIILTFLMQIEAIRGFTFYKAVQLIREFKERPKKESRLLKLMIVISVLSTLPFFYLDKTPEDNGMLPFNLIFWGFAMISLTIFIRMKIAERIDLS